MTINYIVAFTDSQRTKVHLTEHLKFLSGLNSDSPITKATFLFTQKNVSDYKKVIEDADLFMAYQIVSEADKTLEYAWEQAMRLSNAKQDLFLISGGQVPKSNDWYDPYYDSLNSRTGWVYTEGNDDGVVNPAGLITAATYGLQKRRGLFTDLVDRGAEKSSHAAQRRAFNVFELNRFNVVETNQNTLKKNVVRKKKES